MHTTVKYMSHVCTTSHVSVQTSLQWYGAHGGPDRHAEEDLLLAQLQHSVSWDSYIAHREFTLRCCSRGSIYSCCQIRLLGIRGFAGSDVATGFEGW